MNIKNIQLAMIITATFSNASTIQNIEVGADVWFSKNHGEISNYNVKSDSNKFTPSIFVDAKTKGELPNIRLNYTRIKNDSFKSNLFDVVLYSDIVNKQIFKNTTALDVDAGLGVRRVDGVYKDVSFDITIPTVYVKTKISPNYHSKSYASASVIIAPHQDNHLDTKFAIGTQITKNLSSEIGYRKNKINFHDRAENLDMYTKGFYANVSYIFGIEENKKVEVKNVVENNIYEDSDKDGVSNTDDFCPKTYLNYSIDSRGCAGYQIDDDGDGYTNDIDKCPNSLDLKNIGDDGCTIIASNPKVKIIKIKNLHFNRVSATLSKDSLNIADKLTRYLKQNPNYKVSIQGHTSNLYPNSRQSNIALSKKRAGHVADFLISRGVSKSLISTSGYGPDKPIATNDTNENRAKNRRVEVYLTPITK